MFLAMLIDAAQIVAKISAFNASYVDDGILLVNHEVECTKRTLQKLAWKLERSSTWGDVRKRPRQAPQIEHQPTHSKLAARVRITTTTVLASRISPTEDFRRYG
jgi:hypothetical protein